MTDAFELRHQAARKGVALVRVWPLVLATLLLAFATALLVALITQDLNPQDRILSGFLAACGTIGAGLVLHRAWRTWPAVSASLVVIRLDETGPQLRKGRYRDDTWYQVPWSFVEAVTLTPLVVPPDAAASLRRLRLLRFVPRPSAQIPTGPPGMFDSLLRLPPRESVLAFVAAPTWDDDLRQLLDWVRVQHPELRVEDSVPR